MALCMNVGCLFCTLCVFIILTSLLQLFSGIYFAIIRDDTSAINRIVKIDQFDSYLLYIILVWIGLGLTSLILSFCSIYSTIRRFKTLLLFVTTLWIFAAALNIILLIVSLLYYFFTLPELNTLLTRTFPHQSLSNLELFDILQSRYGCCGINGQIDYANSSIGQIPPSCCRESKCWIETPTNDHNSLNSTEQSMYLNGCYPTINEYVKTELLGLIGGTIFNFLLQILTITCMCSLYQRYRNFDYDPKFVINHLSHKKSMNDSDNNIKESSRTIEETVEITQI